MPATGSYCLLWPQLHYAATAILFVFVHVLWCVLLRLQSCSHVCYPSSRVRERKKGGEREQEIEREQERERERDTYTHTLSCSLYTSRSRTHTRTSTHTHTNREREKEREPDLVPNAHLRIYRHRDTRRATLRHLQACDPVRTHKPQHTRHVITQRMHPRPLTSCMHARPLT